MKLRRGDSPLTIVLGRLSPCHGQRTHRPPLEPEQLFRHLLVFPVRRTHRTHDFGRTLHANDPAARNTALDNRRHILALGGEGQPVDDLRARTQRFVVLALRVQPFEQRPFGRIADHGTRNIEEGRRIGGYDLGEIVHRQRVVAHQLLHVHPVLSQRTGLVGTNHRHRPHRFAGMHAPHEVIGLEHPPHGHGQRQRNAHGQPFGNGHHDDRHRNHEDVQHVLRDGEPVAFEQPVDEDRLAEHDAENSDGKHDACTADQFRKACQLAVERRLLFALDGRLFGNAPGFGRIAHGRRDHHAVTVGDRSAAQHDVRRIGGIGVEMRLVHRFVNFQFARERGFVDPQRHGLDQLAVDRHRLAALDVDHVPDHDVAARDFVHRTVAHHLDRNIVVDLVQPPETPHGIPLEPETDASG